MLVAGGGTAQGGGGAHPLPAAAWPALPGGPGDAVMVPVGEARGRKQGRDERAAEGRDGSSSTERSRSGVRRRRMEDEEREAALRLAAAEAARLGAGGAQRG